MDVLALRRGVVASLVALTALILAGPAAAATTTVECGLFRDYVAPDPLGPTTGSISFGLLGAPETIAADATLTPPADTNLASLTGGVPTALTVVRDAGVITSLSFATSCTLTDDVAFVDDLFGPGADGYVVGDRLVAPISLLDIHDGLSALIPTAAANGVPLTLIFSIDTSMGTPSAFDAQLTLVGEVELEGDGDILIGAARLPNSVISNQARGLLAEAAELGVEATVVVIGEGGPDAGSPGGVAMAISLDVSFEAPAPPPSEPTVPDTSMLGAAARPTPWLLGALLLLLGAGWVLGARIFSAGRYSAHE
jgi:hypothetical protein